MSPTKTPALGSSDLSNQGHICTNLCVREGSEQEWMHVERPTPATGKENVSVYADDVGKLDCDPPAGGDTGCHSGGTSVSAPLISPLTS